MVYLDKLEERKEKTEEHFDEPEMPKGFVHLHVHTEYSLLDGMSSVQDLPAYAKSLGMNALAITDHGNMFGCVKFAKSCKKAGIKPIIGCEVYTAERRMEDKDSEKDRAIGHLILLCKDRTGYENLIKIVSRAYTEGFYYKPRTDKEMLRKHHEGLICLSGCLAGKTQRLLIHDDYEGAKKEAKELLDIFGEDFYLELQDHGQEEDKKSIEGLLKLSKELNIPLVATNDAHYIKKEDATAHEMLLCMQTQQTINTPKRFRFNAPEYYLKSEDEMRKLFSYAQEACDNTARIAEKCNFEFEFGNYHIPTYTPPAPFKTNEQYFRRLCYDGMKKWYKEITPELKERLEYEISVIVKMGFVEYFLTVWDFINFAKSKGIPVGPGRGCADKHTRIYTEDGLKYISDIKTGMKVYTHDGTLQTVEATYAYPVNEPLIQINCHFGQNDPETGLGNAFTYDHKIYAVKAEKLNGRYVKTNAAPDWIPVSELKVGDLVAFPNNGDPCFSRLERSVVLGEITDKYILKRITGMRTITEPAVYDIQVANNHSYVTSSFIAHNSAAGSVVAYCLSITEIEPMKYNLFFERFLNPERVSMPDIDVDFCIRRRQEVIDYVTEKYGEDNVCQISTFITMKAKMAAKDVARVLEVPFSDSNRLSKLIPDDMNLTEAIETDPDLKSEYNQSPISKNVLDTAIKLEDIPRNASTHAAGVVIAPAPVSDFVPLVTSKKGIATQYTMTEIEELGLLKMDFLGLRNLTVIQDTLDQIKKNHGKDIDMSSLDLADPNVYEMLSKGKTVGVFQLEGKGITDFLKKLKPTRFEDIIAGVALYRPGPMDSIPQYLENKKHPDKIQYVTPELASILDVTYGCIVYQEEVMQIVQKLAGYSFARADLVRRAMSKKKADVMAEEREYFINGKVDAEGNIEIPGCIRNGISKAAAEKIFDDMESFAQYAFNKSHATAYSVVTYQTAWLKYYYPSEFMAALMTSEEDKHDHLAVFIKEAKKMNVTGGNKRIKILPPDVNKSEASFTSDSDGNIIYGLAAIKGVGRALAEEIAKGTYSDIFDLAGVDKMNSKALESLAYSGAMREITPSVTTALDNIKSALNFAKSAKTDQVTLFDLGFDEARPEVEELPEMPYDQMLLNEKAYLGSFITDHPLKKYKKTIKEFAKLTASDITDGAEGTHGIIAGMISNVDTHFTKKGDKMAFVSLDDIEDDPAEIVVFPQQYLSYSSMLEEGAIVCFYGKINGDSFICEQVIDIDNLPSFAQIHFPKKDRNRYELRIRGDKEDYQKVMPILARQSGNTPVRWYMPNGKSGLVNIKVPYDNLLLIKLQDKLGDENVKYAKV